MAPVESHSFASLVNCSTVLRANSEVIAWSRISSTSDLIDWRALRAEVSGCEKSPVIWVVFIMLCEGEGSSEPPPPPPLRGY